MPARAPHAVPDCRARGVVSMDLPKKELPKRPSGRRGSIVGAADMIV